MDFLVPDQTSELEERLYVVSFPFLLSPHPDVLTSSKALTDPTNPEKLAAHVAKLFLVVTPLTTCPVGTEAADAYRAGVTARSMSIGESPPGTLKTSTDWPL